MQKKHKPISLHHVLHSYIMYNRGRQRFWVIDYTILEYASRAGHTMIHHNSTILSNATYLIALDYYGHPYSNCVYTYIVKLEILTDWWLAYLMAALHHGCALAAGVRGFRSFMCCVMYLRLPNQWQRCQACACGGRQRLRSHACCKCTAIPKSHIITSHSVLCWLVSYNYDLSRF